MSVRFVESTLAAAVLLFVWGAVTYAGLLRSFFPRHFSDIARPKDDAKLGWVALEKVLQGFLLSLSFWLVFPGVTTLPQALVFGGLAGGLLEVSFFFGTWTSFRVGAKGVAVPALIGFLRFVAAGALIGVVHG